MYFGPEVTGTSDSDDSDVAKAVLYFRRDIKTTEEYVLYSPLSMLAEIGGYVGLLMGVSLFKLVDVNNFCLDLYANKKKAQLDTESEEDAIYVHSGRLQRQ